MKISPRPWQVFVVAALLPLGELAVSAELLEGAKIKESPTKNVATQEAHGLLANRFSNPASETPAPQEAASDDREHALPPQSDQPTFRTAIWNDTLNMHGLNGEMASAPTFNTAFGNHIDSPSPISESSCSSLNVNDDDCGCCPDPLWCHRCGVFADLLYLRPGNIDYIYAVEQTGPLPTDSPTGPTGRVGFDAALGYRLGVTYALSDCSSLQASYTWFQEDTQNTINTTPGTVLIFQPGDPSIPNVGATSIQASANYNIRFQQADFDYRGLLYGTCDSAVNYFAGLRYANLKQDFHAQEDIGVPFGLTDARTHISFDGFGIGFGLDGMRRSASSGLLVYGRSSASFVSGEFKADYRQTTQFGPNSVVGNNLVDFRVLSILQTEIGTGWQSQCGRVRITAGYQFAGWFNALTTGSYILGVQNRQFNNLNETITFDGLVTRLLVQF